MAIPEHAAPFAHQTYDWLILLDPVAFKLSALGEVRAGLEAVRTSAQGLNAHYDQNAPKGGGEVRVRQAFDALVSALPNEAPGEDRVAWLLVRERISPLYEAFALSLKSAGYRVQHLHPTNYLRSAVHLASGLAVVAAFQFVFTQYSAIITASAFVVWAWSLEGARRVSPMVNALCMKFFGPIARDHERYRVNSATWYGTALLVLALTAFGPAGVLGLLALAVGDPLAGMIGRTYGQIRIPGGKSLEGCVAFAIATMIVGYGYLAFFQWTLAPIHILLVLAVVAGIAGSIIELLSVRLEDNFTIPVFTAWVLQGALWLFT